MTTLAAMLRIWLFGELHAELDGRPLERISSRRARSLLAWLALNPGLHPRSRVASVFWPDVLEESARTSLRTTLATLRRECRPAAAFVAATRERVGIEDSEDLCIDTRAADGLAADGRLDEALELRRRGVLLADLDDDWVLEARDLEQARLSELLGLLGSAAEVAGDGAAAVGYAREQARIEPLSEEVARTLMRRLAAGGDRAGAIAAFEALREKLGRELAIAPSAETRTLIEHVRAEGARTAGRPGAAAPPASLVREDPVPLVGRARELERMAAAWRSASAGDLRVLVLRGEAGSGKTRLLRAMARDVHAGGATVLAGRCFAEAVTPYGPFAEALRPYASRPESLPEWVAAEVARLVPGPGLASAPSDGPAEDARHRLFEAVAALLGEAARGGPVLLALEDLHWAEHSTLLMLAHVTRTVAWAPVLVVATIRDGEPRDGRWTDELLAELRRERRLDEIEVRGLPEAEVGELVSAWLGRPASASLAATVHRRTGGNPLFVEEVARHLYGEEAADEERQLETVASALPAGVGAAIEHRLAGLGEPVRQALAIAAVLGDEFDLLDVTAASGLSHAEAVDALDAGLRARLIEEAMPAGRYRFGHALVRDAVLARLSAGRRALVHRRVAEALERLSPDRLERRLPELARHFAEAAPTVEPRKAADYALRAGERSLAQLAYAEAAAILARGLEALGDEDPERRVELLLALGDARGRAGAPQTARAAFDEAAAGARALGDPELLARAALGLAGIGVAIAPAREHVRALLEEALAAVDGSSPLRPVLASRLSIELYYVPPARRRERLSLEALHAGRRVGGRALLEALGARHVALWGPDHVEERLGLAEELVEGARRLGDREAELQGLNWRVVDLVDAGALDEARAAIESYEALAGEARLPGYRWYGPMWRAMFAGLAGRFAEAERLTEEAAGMGRAAGDDNAELLLGIQRLSWRFRKGDLTDDEVSAIERRAGASPARTAWRGWLAKVHAQRSDEARAREELDRALAALPELPADANWLYSVTALGELSAELCELRSAERLYRMIEPYAGRNVAVGRATVCTGCASLSLGLLAAALGNGEGARRHLAEAVDVNRRLGARPELARAETALAGLVTRTAPSSITPGP
jgi:DNA-binding SARP family transcriptional activator/tetratricopeptide (TPR) repeat protein